MKFDLMELDSKLDDDTIPFPQKFYNPYHPKENLSLAESDFAKTEPMLKILFQDGKRTMKKHSWKDAQNAMKSDLKQLPEQFSRIDNPDQYNIYI